MEYEIKLPVPELTGEKINFAISECGKGTITDATLVSVNGKADIVAEILFDNGNRKKYYLSICCKNSRFEFRSDETTKESILLLANRKMKAYLDDYEKAQNARLEEERHLKEEREEAERITRELQREAAIAAERNEAYRFLTEDCGVEYLVHFTPIENLQSIIDNGIVPREILEKQGIPSVKPDEKRIDGRPDCTSFSISFPNYQLLFKNRLKKITFAILMIDPIVLCDVRDNSVYYLPDNAARMQAFGFSNFTSISALYNMFAEQVVTNLGLKTRDDLHLPSAYPSNPQAEVFLSGIIPPKYIKRIRVENFKTLKPLREALTLPANCEESFLYYDAKLFSYRCDWEYWK